MSGSSFILAVNALVAKRLCLPQPGDSTSAVGVTSKTPLTLRR